MTVGQFLDLLQQYPRAELHLAYSPTESVPLPYHITEVLKMQFTSVDCGGNEHSGAYTMAQILVNPGESRAQLLTTDKAFKIFEVVQSKQPLDREQELYFEYGNDQIPTARFAVDSFEHANGQLVLKLYAPAAVCKPRLQLAGVAEGGGCC